MKTAEQARQEASELARNLAGMEGLTERIAVYVPSIARDGQPLPGELVAGKRRDVVRRLATVAGGATISEASGAWVHADGSLAVEPVAIAWAACSPDGLAELVAVAFALARELRRDMEQEAVSVEICGSLYFVGE